MRFGWMLAGLVILAPAAVNAQPPKPLPVPAPWLSLDRLNEEVKQLYARTAPQLAVVQQVSLTYQGVVHRVDELRALGAANADRPEVEKWLASWEPQAQAQVAAYRAQIAVWKPFEAKDSPIVFTYGAGAGLDVEGLKQVPVHNRQLVARLLDETDEIISAEHKAALGGAAESQQLRAVLVGSDGVMLEAQNATLSFSASTQPVASPSRYYLQSIVAANKAHIAFNTALAQEVAGRSVDGKPVADEMRRSIVEERTLTRRLRDAATNVKARIAADPQAKSALGVKETKMLQTYLESADVEDDYAKVLEQMADSVGAGLQPSATLPSLRSLLSLQQKRSDISLRRTQISAQ